MSRTAVVTGSSPPRRGRGRGRRWAGRGRHRSCRCRGCRGSGRCGARGAVADEADDVGQGGEVAQFEVLVAGDIELLPHGGEDFGLLDRVDAQVGFHVQVQVQQVTGVPGEPLDDVQDRRGDRVVPARRGRGRGRRWAGRGRHRSCRCRGCRG